MPCTKLFVGYKAAELAPEDLTDDTLVHVLDIYHQHAIEKVFPRSRVVCSAHLPEGDWREVRFRTGPKLMSGELALDLYQECLAAVKGDLKRVKLEYIGRERDRNDLIDKVKARADRRFRAEWPASVPGGRKLSFTSYPGCFCHRRLDEGGLALAEVVTKRMEKEKGKGENGQGVKILDMGCGCGLVGLLIADFFRQSKVSLTLIDSHARAVEAAKENAAKFQLPAEVILSDDGLGSSTRAYDLFVGNPPYYSDYRIAEVFLETARKNLKSGGVCYTVCKNAAGLEPVQKRYFPTVEILSRRGYAVLRSVKS